MQPKVFLLLGERTGFLKLLQHMGGIVSYIAHFSSLVFPRLDWRNKPIIVCVFTTVLLAL